MRAWIIISASVYLAWTLSSKDINALNLYSDSCTHVDYIMSIYLSAISPVWAVSPEGWCVEGSVCVVVSQHRGGGEDTRSPHPLTPLSSPSRRLKLEGGGTRLELLYYDNSAINASIYIHNTFISSLQNSLAGPHLSTTTSTKAHTLITNTLYIS